MRTIPVFRPPGTGAALCRHCGFIFKPIAAHHVVCKRCHQEARRYISAAELQRYVAACDQAAG